MNPWKEKKEAFFRLAIETGMSIPEEIRRAMPLGSDVEESRLQKWLSQLTGRPKKFASTRRYVNRFKLGADPEFVFVARGKEEAGINPQRCNANLLGLSQGPAFGSDNNGRLAEIRPFPSRSAVEVVASILTTLRWMALLRPETQQYEWWSGAYLWEDGIGGHVHFGRKRPFREREIKALDAIEEGLLGLGVFPGDQIKQRRRGDAHRQVYGMPGDFRLQAHGYEYRTFPSWLDSPDLSFLTIVVSKLAVQNPGLYSPQLNDPRVGLQRLKNFLSFFKWVDDDARLALVILERGLPIHRGGDFRGRWGIPTQVKDKAQAQVIPLSIKPDKESIFEVFHSLLNGVPFQWRVPQFTWGPVNPPRGLKMCLPVTNTIQFKGLGEMIWDWCTPINGYINISGSGRGATPLLVSSMNSKKWPSDWRTRLGGIARADGIHENSIQIAPEWREGGNAKKMSKLILESGLFPVWRVGEAKDSTAEEWMKKPKVELKRRGEFQGKVIMEFGNWRIGPLEGRT